MVELTTTNITASTISEIFYISDVDGNVDVYIPITASSISENSTITLSGDSVDSWCHNVSLMYAMCQPQGNVWFLHIMLDRYVYNPEDDEQLMDRFVDVHAEILTKVSTTPVIIDHRIIQNGCEEDKSSTCQFDVCTIVSNPLTHIVQNCNNSSAIIDEYKGTKIHVLTQDCTSNV